MEKKIKIRAQLVNQEYATPENELAAFRMKKLRKAYNAKMLDVYDLDDIENARVELLKYKTPLMREWDGMIHDIVHYLTDCLMAQHKYIGGSHDETKDICEVLRIGYDTILNHNDTEDFEYKYLAFAKALHEWIWRFRFSEKAEEHRYETEELAEESVWLRILEDMANGLVDEINQIDEMDDKSMA